jgi:hypothetical protein
VPSVNLGEIGVTPTPESTISQIEAII